jgi:tetratricopeptide (TPR) repeat protein
MLRDFSIRGWGWKAAAGLWLGLLPVLGMTAALGQQTPPPAPAQDKPKPDAPKPDAPKSDNDNPFPGENSNAPIIPVEQPADPKATTMGRKPAIPMEDAGVARPAPDPDGDPVRSPESAEGAEGGSDDGFSSSRSGLNHLPVEDDAEVKPGSSAKVKTRLQVVKEDVDVGNFYLEKKNWKAAQARFASAFQLDPENADAVFGMAEAERHLDLFKDAAEHYKVFLSYDPDGPHGKAARKGLDQAEAGLAHFGNGAASAAPKP